MMIMYEHKREGFMGWIHIQLIKLLNRLPSSVAQRIFLAFSGKHGDTVTVFQNANAAAYKALEVMYTFPERKAKGKVNLTNIFWENFLDNARSIRNRLALVKKEIIDTICTVATKKRTVHLLSVGSGSARPVLEAVALFNGQFSVEVMLIERDKAAIEFSKTLAAEFHINHTTQLTENFFRLERESAEFRPDVVELVGLLDYLTEKQAIVLLKKVLQVLVPGGYLIAGNIAPNPEAPFVAKGINWPTMIYRTPQEFRNLLIEAGFPLTNIRITREPLGIHTLAIVHKVVEPQGR